MVVDSIVDDRAGQDLAALDDQDDVLKVSRPALTIALGLAERNAQMAGEPVRLRWTF